MNYRLLGKSGLRVSEVSLGTMTFGEDWGWGAAKDESRRIYDVYRDRGGNFIDTANLYTNGSSETLVGEFLHGHRDQMVLATKYTLAAPGTDANAAGNHRKSMVTAIEASLKRLKTDYIDLYWLHAWDQLTPVDEVMRALDDLVRHGKILYLGVSDAPAWWIAQANTLAFLRGWTPFVALQIEYNLLERTVERELTPMANAFGLTLAAWSPLAGGVLTGKYADKKAPLEGRFSNEMMRTNRPTKDREMEVLGALREIGSQTGRSQAQVALAWLRHRDLPVIPILGARKLSQFEDNLDSLSLSLSQEQVAALDTASEMPLGFPHDFYSREMVRGFIYGGLRDRILA